MEIQNLHPNIKLGEPLGSISHTCLLFSRDVSGVPRCSEVKVRCSWKTGPFGSMSATFT